MGKSDLVFPSPSITGRCITDNCLLRALRRLGYEKTEMCIHGFRSIASTLLREKGYPREIVEAQLAHKIHDAVEAAYNRAQYLEQRREMMQAWADYLDSLLLVAGYTPEPSSFDE